ncbi:EVE domain-containing protein [Candidatus Kaiserbacteria bacterium]|nr:EVE domain-containing protein [Candidatus Kaiserbacteria bacterium]MCB9811807.1 EVE domain-containing protein [Candidatus Nomurabacteria bacterium]
MADTQTGQGYWIMKSEPSCYSIDDLKRDKKTMWDGVRNYQVRNMMRDQMQAGDLALFYHSSTKEVGVVGVMEIVGKAYPDPTQFDPKSDHPDPTSDPKSPRWLCVDVAFKQKFPQVVSLELLKESKPLQQLQILKRGNRLSVTPVTKNEFECILKMAV